MNSDFLDEVIKRPNDNELIIRTGDYPAVFDRLNDNALINRMDDNVPMERP